MQRFGKVWATLGGCASANVHEFGRACLAMSENPRLNLAGDLS
jgi:hypothetical protein